MADSTSQQLLQLIYASAATLPFSERDLRTLLLKARINNERLGVTGMLPYQGGSFLQVLEGTSEAVQQVYTTISRDKRHNRVVKLSEKWVAAREFGDWSMGFVPEDRNATSQIRGFNDFFRWRAEESSKPDAAGALRIVHAFREGRFRTSIEG